MQQEFEDLVARSEHIRPLRKLEGHTEVVRGVAFSPDGHRLASGSANGTINLWDIETGGVVTTFEDRGQAYSVDFSPDGCWLASASYDHTVRLWEVSTGDFVSNLAGHTDSVYSVAFSLDGCWLASGSYDHTVRLWEVSTGRLVSILQGHTDVVYSVAFSLDGRWLASGSYDRTVRLWEVSTGRLISTLYGHTNRVLSVAFSPDGWLASGSVDQTVRLWEVPSGNLVSILQGHTGHVNSAIFSPDGKVLVSTSGDGSVRFWETRSCRLICALSQAKASSSKVPFALSPDGRLLATYPPRIRKLTTIQLWDISALGVGPWHASTTPEESGQTEEMQALLLTQLSTFPFCHVLAPDVAPARAVGWLRGAAAAGWPLPLALAYDLGLLLSLPAERRSLVKPTYLPFEEDTSAYLSCLERLAAHPLVRDLPSWSPPLTDTVLSVLLARLVEGLELPQDYCLPVGLDGACFLRTLDHELVRTDAAILWQQTPADAQPSWQHLLSPSALARLERNLQALDREELRFLAHYGSLLPGSPDPRTLLDLLALTGLPAPARLALSQTLRLLPQMSASVTHRLGGIQTYPEGGYEGLARQGSLESLLPSENVYPDDLFLYRVLNHEALYYGRERSREQRHELVYLVGQLGWGLGGDGQVLVRALLLALGQAMRKLGYEVFYSLAGATLSEPHPLEKPADIGRLLYAQERGVVDSEAVLQGVLGQLRAWREDYRGRQVLWVLSENFDWDDARGACLMVSSVAGRGRAAGLVCACRSGCVPTASR